MNGHRDPSLELIWINLDDLLVLLLLQSTQINVNILIEGIDRRKIEKLEPENSDHLRIIKLIIHRLHVHSLFLSGGWVDGWMMRWFVNNEVALEPGQLNVHKN